MRLYSLIAVCALAGCMSNHPDAQVSKSYPDATAGGLALPAMQTFGPVAHSATSRPNGEIAQDFLDLEFQLESGRNLAVLSRFEGPITVALTGAVPASAPAEMTKLISRFRTEAGLDIGYAAPGQDASITVEFLPRAQMQPSMADSKPTRDRKRSARSRVDCICGLPDSSDSMRTPLMACVLIWLSSLA